MALPAGFRLGPYEILDPLGAGGMGEVYRARDTRLERDVAVKVLPETLLSEPQALVRFEREARLVAALSHSNILAIHDVGRDNGVSYAVTELLEGETLRERMGAETLPVRKALDCARQVARGLAAAHARGIVHRDLKPENVFVTRDGLVKILDFGLAKRELSGVPPGASVQATAARTVPGTILGTVGYMSPEQVRGEEADSRSDIFSFGSVLYELLFGEPAFRSDTDVETMTAILREDPPRLRGRGTVPAELVRIAAHCLEKKREERFQSASDLAFALGFLEGEPAESVSDAPTARRVSGSRSSATVSDSSRASIAVLPFRNMSADKENEYFSDGITEEIINALTKIEALRVASRTSAFAFKGRDEDIRRIGEQLGVRAVLEGSVRRAGTRLRITAELVSVADGYQLWSERYDREMEDIFAIQDEIALAIANTLKVRLLAADEGAIVSRGTEDFEAYNHYLKGKYFFNRRVPRQAIAEFEEAISRDPGYAAAHTGLADAYCIFGFYGGIPTLDAFAKARAAASKAKELEPDSPEVHVSLGLVEHYYGWDLELEEREFRRAIELDPLSASAYSWLGLVLAFSERSDEALEMARRAAKLEPLSPNAQTNVAWCFFARREYEEALFEVRRALALDPDALYPLWMSGLTLQMLGNTAESVAAFERAVVLTGHEQTYYLALLGGGYAAAGRRDDARRVLGDLRERSSREYVAPYHLAFLYVPLGDRDAAVAALERACEERNALAWWPRTSPAFDPIRDHPRFESLLSKIRPA